MNTEHVYVAGMAALIVLLAVLLMYLASITLMPRHAGFSHFCYNDGSAFCAYA